MQRLIKDANEYAASIGESSNLTIDSFADIVDAIDLIQQKQQIQGTSQKEALSTIEGSANAAKASWQNFLTAIGSGDTKMLQESTEGLIVSLFGTWDDELQRRSGGIVNNVLPILDNVKTTLIENIPDVAEGVATQFMDSFMAAMGVSAEDRDTFIDNFLEKMEQFEERARELGDTISQIFEGFGTGFSENIDLSGYEGSIDNLYEGLKGFFQLIADNSESIGSFFGTISTAIGNISESIGDEFLWDVDPSGFADGLKTVSDTISDIFSFVEEHGEEIGGIIGDIVSIAGNLFSIAATFGSEVWPVIEPVIGTLLEDLKWLLDRLKEVTDWAKNELPVFIDEVKNKFSEISQWFENLPQNIQNSLGDLGGLLVGAGESVIQGFFQGLKDAWDNVTGWISGIGEWIAEHKGPKEYDLKLLVPNGMWIMDSLNTGLMKGLPKVEKTLRGITGTIESGVTANLQMGSVSYDNGNSQILSMLAEIRDKDSNVYLDSGALVGGMAPQMNVAIGRL